MAHLLRDGAVRISENPLSEKFTQRAPTPVRRGRAPRRRDREGARPGTPYGTGGQRRIPQTGETGQGSSARGTKKPGGPRRGVIRAAGPRGYMPTRLGGAKSMGKPGGLRRGNRGARLNVDEIVAPRRCRPHTPNGGSLTSPNGGFGREGPVLRCGFGGGRGRRGRVAPVVAAPKEALRLPPNFGERPLHALR